MYWYKYEWHDAILIIDHRDIFYGFSWNLRFSRIDSVYL